MDAREELIAEARTPVYASTSDEVWGRGGVAPVDRDGLIERLTDALESQLDLERVKREAGAAALRQAAEATRDAYPVDLFIPIDAERVKQAQKVLAGIGLTVDGFSAMAMRHWATLTDRMADAIERGE